MAEWHIQHLSRDHDRTAFRSGQVSLDEFLAKLAGQYERKGVARTFVATEPGQAHVRGYYTLAAGGVDVGDLPSVIAKKLPRHSVPIVLLARLAVDVACQGQGLGAFLLKDALHRCEKMAVQLGIYAVIVDAIDERAVNFYVKYGFGQFKDNARKLYLTLETLRKGAG